MELAHTTNYAFNIQTVQSGAFRVLIEALKDILTDCNFIIDSTGIKLIATDSSHNVLIHMKLHSENFDFYECTEKSIIGVNMTNYSCAEFAKILAFCFDTTNCFIQ